MGHVENKEGLETPKFLNISELKNVGCLYIILIKRLLASKEKEENSVVFRYFNFLDLIVIVICKCTLKNKILIFYYKIKGFQIQRPMT